MKPFDEPSLNPLDDLPLYPETLEEAEEREYGGANEEDMAGFPMVADDVRAPALRGDRTQAVRREGNPGWTRPVRVGLGLSPGLRRHRQSDQPKARMTDGELIREIETDHVRRQTLEQLYRLARAGVTVEFVAAFDRYDRERARELQAWKKLATDALNCQTPVYVLHIDKAQGEGGEQPAGGSGGETPPAPR